MTGSKAASVGTGQAVRYGLMGLPLAFVALPLYVFLPNHYARAYGVPLATLGSLLLWTRAVDAVLDPWLGAFSDRLYARGALRAWAVGGGLAGLMALGFTALFFPPTLGATAFLVFVGAMLVLTYVGFSGLTLIHQSWGAQLGAAPEIQSRVVGWREGLGLVGVMMASVAPVTLGLGATVALLWGLLAMAWWAWQTGPRPRPALPSAQFSSPSPSDSGRPEGSGAFVSALWTPWRHASFRHLIAVFMLNGVASAVPATLMLFFVQDRLQAAAGLEAVFLAAYFLTAAASMPLWLALVRRIGLARSWRVGLLLAMVAFVWAAGLTGGDTVAFGLICAGSGLALGADLVMPGALLAGVVERSGDLGRAQGPYYGWWALATKLNLALAAGLALPLLALGGYTPGAHEAGALRTLTWAYCLLPCALKVLAALLLHLFFIRRGEP